MQDNRELRNKDIEKMYQQIMQNPGCDLDLLAIQARLPENTNPEQMNAFDTLQKTVREARLNQLDNRAAPLRQNANQPQRQPISLFNYQPIYIGNQFNNNYNNAPQNREQENAALAKAAIEIVMIAMMAAFYVSGEVTQQITDDIERLALTNEGSRAYFDGALMIIMAVMLGGLGAAGVASLIVGSNLAAPGLLIGFAAIAFGVIGAGIGAYIAGPLADLCELHPDPLSSQDAYRYDLTPAEEGRLNEAGFDLILVKCVILAIRDRITHIKQHASWSIYRDEETIGLLNHLRSLRNNDCEPNEVFLIDGISFPVSQTNVEPALAEACAVNDMSPVAFAVKLDEELDTYIYTIEVEASAPSF